MSEIEIILSKIFFSSPAPVCFISTSLFITLDNLLAKVFVINL